jgi:DNA-binding NarL/FixJ family response regulator
VAASRERLVHSAAAAMRQARVLLVDDSEGTLSTALRTPLNQHQVEIARDAFEAIYRIDCAGAPHDAIICDLARGDLPGPELWSYLSLTRGPAAERMLFVTSGPLTVAARTFLRCVPNPCVDLRMGLDELLLLVDGGHRSPGPRKAADRSEHAPSPEVAEA